jgi:hypothetical protein
VGRFVNVGEYVYGFICSAAADNIACSTSEDLYQRAKAMERTCEVQIWNNLNGRIREEYLKYRFPWK